MEGAVEQTNGNKKKTGSVPKVEAKPGTNPVFSKVTMQKTAGEKGSFVHDYLTVGMIADSIAHRMHPYEEHFSNVPMEFNEFHDLIYRMVSFLMARKLSNSIATGQDDAIASQLGKIASAGCQGPSALILLLDHFGQITEEDLQFRMLGQPLLAFSYFGRATVRDLANRNATLFVNTRWVNFKRTLFDYCIGVINAWAASHQPQGFMFNGAPVVMQVPKVYNGVQTWAGLVNAVPRDGEIDRLIAVASLIEPFLDGVINQEGIQALAALNVMFVDWASVDIGGRIQAYKEEVESRILGTMQTKMNMVEVGAMKTTGSPAQILRISTDHIYFSPYMLGGKVLDLGWLFAGRYSNVVPNRDNFYLIPPKTKYDGILSFVDGMMK